MAAEPDKPLSSPMAASTPSLPAAPLLVPPFATTLVQPVNEDLLGEIRLFQSDSMARYKFNNTWDVFLTVLGILLSIAVVVSGFVKRPEVSAILGAIVGAVVTAQKAFPFGQRASFYRLLIGQSSNLITRASQGVIGKAEAVNTLSSMRMDFAQQLPRGSSYQPGSTVDLKQGTPQTDDGQRQDPQKQTHDPASTTMHNEQLEPDLGGTPHV